jgi:hypothetical protein
MPASRTLNSLLLLAALPLLAQSAPLTSQNEHMVCFFVSLQETLVWLLKYELTFRFLLRR